METSLTTIFNESNEPIVAFTRMGGGEFYNHGESLAVFLQNKQVVPYSPFRKPGEIAGMVHLASQIISHFEKNFGAIYIVPHNCYKPFEYEVRYVYLNNSNFSHVSLVGWDGYKRENKTFKLYPEPATPILRTVTFVYDKLDGSGPSWRTVEVIEETKEYVAGIEDGKFKKFLKKKIFGGRILPA